MKPPETPVCKEPAAFPAEITNRAGLDRIAYRIGAYGTTRRWLLEQLDRTEALAAWTYRGADDPGIALYEGVALLVDSLTAYQEAYANEAYLRTAAWRESVADLVRLTGYRLTPGLGGKGTVAFSVSGTRPVTIPAGVAVQATLASAPQQVDLATSEEVVALPHLSRFSLVRPQGPGWLQAGARTLVVARDTPLTFQKNDRIAVGVLGPGGAHLGYGETVIVESVETWHGRSVLTLKGPLRKPPGRQRTLTAVKLGQTSHFVGHMAPPIHVTVGANGGAHGVAVGFDRFLGGAFERSFPAQAANEIAIEPRAKDLALGTRLAIQIVVRPTGHSHEVATAGMMMRNLGEVTALGDRPVSWFLLAEIADARSVTVSYGSLAVPATVVTLTKILGFQVGGGRFDIREGQVDTIVGEPFGVEAAWETVPAPTTHLVYWGARPLDLKGRRIGILPAGKPSYTATVLEVVPHGDHATVVLDRHVDVADFGEGNATIVVGNLADVTEGKREKPTVLGSGDDRASFQSFAIPRTPLTYLAPGAPELEVIVGGRIWKHVPVLFGQSSDAEVYIVRQDETGKSWVQFGDGKTGARLPSGVDNVSIRYRTGTGAYGPVADGSRPSADRTVPQVTDVDLVGLVAGGSEPEDAARAKTSAPARVQTLDRLVSITDIEAEALAIGGVARARARWTILHGSSVIQVTLLMQQNRTAGLADAHATLAAANRARGPQRYPIVIVPGEFAYTYLDLTIAIDARLDARMVRDATTEAVRALFADRDFGEAEYATRIEGVAQNVDGVRWAVVNTFGGLGVTADPTTLVAPDAPTRAEVVACAPTQVLQLGPYTLHTVTEGA